MTGGRVSEVRNLRAVVTVSLLEEDHTPSETSQYGVCVIEEVGIEGCYGDVDVGSEGFEGGVEEVGNEGSVGVSRRLRGKVGTEGGVGCVEVGIEGCEEEVGIENTEGRV